MPPRRGSLDDTLAPLVRQRFDESNRPGQRAHRILENRMVDWKDGQEGTPLDPADLMVVEAGLSGVGALDVDQRRLFDASLQRRTRERMKARRNRTTAAVMVGALLAVVATAIILQRRSEVARRAAIAATWMSRANDLVKLIRRSRHWCLPSLEAIRSRMTESEQRFRCSRSHYRLRFPAQAGVRLEASLSVQTANRSSLLRKTASRGSAHSRAVLRQRRPRSHHL